MRGTPSSLRSRESGLGQSCRSSFSHSRYRACSLQEDESRQQRCACHSAPPLGCRDLGNRVEPRNVGPEGSAALVSLHRGLLCCSLGLLREPQEPPQPLPCPPGARPGFPHRSSVPKDVISKPGPHPHFRMIFSSICPSPSNTCLILSSSPHRP